MQANFYWLVFLCLAASATSSAQTTAKATVGKPYEVIDATSKYYFSRQGEILTVKIKKDEVSLQKMNAATLAFKSVRMYNDFPKGFVIESVAEFRQHYYVFYSTYDGDKELLFAREVDFSKGTFVSTGKKVLSVDQKVTGTLGQTGFYRLSALDKYDFYYSYDSSTMVIQYRVKPEKRSDAKSVDVIGMHVFDSDMNELWGKKVGMPYTEKKMDNLDYSVDSKGNVFIVTRVFSDNSTDEKKRGEDDANYHLEILKVASGTGSITTTKVEVADKFIQGLWLYETSRKGEMVCAGYYNNGSKGAGIDGMILFKLNSDGKLALTSAIEIPLKILNQYASARTRRKNERKDDKDEADFKNLTLRHVFVQPDGGLMLIGEKQYIAQHTSSTPGAPGQAARQSSYTTYHAEDVLVTRLDANGKLMWMEKVPKRQVSGAGFTGISYRYFEGDGIHYLLFLDNEKNMALTTVEVPAVHMEGSGGFLTAYAFDDRTGTMVKKSLVNTRDVNGMEVYQFAPGRLLAPLPNSIVFEAYKKKKEDILIKVDL